MCPNHSSSASWGWPWGSSALYWQVTDLTMALLILCRSRALRHAGSSLVQFCCSPAEVLSGGFLYSNVLPLADHALVHKQSVTRVIYVFQMLVFKKIYIINCIFTHRLIKLNICLLRANLPLTMMSFSFELLEECLTVLTETVFSINWKSQLTVFLVREDGDALECRWLTDRRGGCRTHGGADGLLHLLILIVFCQADVRAHNLSIVVSDASTETKDSEHLYFLEKKKNVLTMLMLVNYAMFSMLDFEIKMNKLSFVKHKM